MSNWISRLDKDGTAKNLLAPDGTVIELYPGKCIVVTPGGYRVQIDSKPLSLRVLGYVDNSGSQEFYNKVINTTK